MVMACAAGWAGRAGAASPATQPSEPALDLPRHPVAMPSRYEVLASRSIFARESPQKRAREADARGPEAVLVLRGVMDQDGSYTAFVEDTAAGKVQQVRAGDSVARGRVTRVTLAGIEYDSAGRVSQVAIGTALDGAAVPPNTSALAGSPRQARSSVAAQPVSAKIPPERVAKVRSKRQNSNGG